LTIPFRKSRGPVTAEGQIHPDDCRISSLHAPQSANCRAGMLPAEFD
jgi:hypothetical protein